MKYAKIINNKLEYCPEALNVNGHTWSPVLPEMAIKAGYKIVIFSDIPDKNFYNILEENYTETENEITVNYTVSDLDNQTWQELAQRLREDEYKLFADTKRLEIEKNALLSGKILAELTLSDYNDYLNIVREIQNKYPYPEQI